MSDNEFEMFHRAETVDAASEDTQGGARGVFPIFQEMRSFLYNGRPTVELHDFQEAAMTAEKWPDLMDYFKRTSQFRMSVKKLVGEEKIRYVRDAHIKASIERINV